MSVKGPTRLGKPARREAVIERRHKVFALRRAGATYESIAETCGISTMQAWRDCQKVLAQLAAKRDANVGAMLELELSRLDQIQVAIWPKVQSGDVLAARVALRVSELRGKLLGLDAPATVTAAIAVARDENRAMLSDDELGSRHEQVVRAVLAARQGVAARYYFGDQPPVEAAVPAKTHQAEPDASSWLLASRRRRNGAYPPG